MRIPTQTERIFAKISAGWTCSAELHEIAWRYSARLHDLRAKGIEIESMPCTHGAHGKGLKHWRVKPHKAPELSDYLSIGMPMPSMMREGDA
jgi:hypothetical protein